jgi:hypothetical protein
VESGRPSQEAWLRDQQFSAKGGALLALGVAFTQEPRRIARLDGGLDV